MVDHVVVGDDVAARIDDEAGAECFLHPTAAVAVFRSTGSLATEKAVEEILEAVRPLIVASTLATAVAIGVLRLERVAVQAAVAGLPWQRLGFDVNDRWSHFLRNSDECVRDDLGINHLERSYMAVRLRILAAHSMSGKGAGDDGDGEDRQQSKSGRQAARTQPVKERFHGLR